MRRLKKQFGYIEKNQNKTLITKTQSDIITILFILTKEVDFMNPTYTCNLEREIWNLAEELDESNNYGLVVDFLNGKDGFQSFGARLAVFISQKLSLLSTDSKTIITALSEQCEKNSVPISEIGSPNTLCNWFKKDKRRKKGPDFRHPMFALAFALNLSVDETKDLFHKIYLDRAFNYRDEKEIIYYFCLKNGKSWTDAARLISNVGDLPKDYSDHTQYTQTISSSVDSFQAEQDLLDYICQNGHNINGRIFEKYSLTAKTKLEFYLSKAKKCAKEEIQYSNERDYYRGKWKKNLSNNTLYDIILKKSVLAKNEENKTTGTKTIFNNASLPQEIKNRFPEAGTFSKKDKTSEEYRKAIILLFSYWFWYQFQYNKKNYSYEDKKIYYEDYEQAINNVLTECNFSELYFGNPFDWMFMCCTYTSTQEDLLSYYQRPLDLFRDLIEQVLNEDS